MLRNAMDLVIIIAGMVHWLHRVVTSNHHVCGSPLAAPHLIVIQAMKMVATAKFKKVAGRWLHAVSGDGAKGYPQWWWEPATEMTKLDIARNNGVKPLMEGQLLLPGCYTHHGFITIG